jgi:hypothetical protein
MVLFLVMVFSAEVVAEEDYHPSDAYHPSKNELIIMNVGWKAITYTVTGTVPKANVMFVNEGGTYQREVSLPWRETFPIGTEGTLNAYVSAQNPFSSGCIKARVYLNTIKRNEGESCIGYGIATASKQF